MTMAYVPLDIVPILRQGSWELDQYGLDVVTAFGEYCGLLARITQKIPRLAADHDTLSEIELAIMHGLETR